MGARAIFLTSLAVAAMGLSACASNGPGGRFGRDLGDAALQPLEDLNLRRDAIPAVLIRALAEPYSTRGLDECMPIALEVRTLNEALGPDQDEPPPPRQGLSEQAVQALADAAVDAVRDETTDFIPLRDWVRRLSGAERHSRRVQAAIQAGRARRAFLKGWGMRQNCAPPAAPSWFRPRPARREGLRWPWG